MFIGKFYQLFKELTPVLLKAFEKIVKEGTVPNSLFEANFILILKSDKDTTRKENYRPKSLMSRDAEILSKIVSEPNSKIL